MAGPPDVKVNLTVDTSGMDLALLRVSVAAYSAALAGLTERVVALEAEIERMKGDGR